MAASGTSTIAALALDALAANGFGALAISDANGSLDVLDALDVLDGAVESEVGRGALTANGFASGGDDTNGDAEGEGEGDGDGDGDGDDDNDANGFNADAPGIGPIVILPGDDVGMDANGFGALAAALDALDGDGLDTGANGLGTDGALEADGALEGALEGTADDAFDVSNDAKGLGADGAFVGGLGALDDDAFDVGNDANGFGASTDGDDVGIFANGAGGGGSGVNPERGGGAKPLDEPGALAPVGDVEAGGGGASSGGRSLACMRRVLGRPDVLSGASTGGGAAGGVTAGPDHTGMKGAVVRTAGAGASGVGGVFAAAAVDGADDDDHDASGSSSGTITSVGDRGGSVATGMGANGSNAVGVDGAASLRTMTSSSATFGTPLSVRYGCVSLGLGRGAPTGMAGKGGGVRAIGVLGDGASSTGATSTGASSMGAPTMGSPTIGARSSSSSGMPGALEGATLGALEETGAGGAACATGAPSTSL